MDAYVTLQMNATAPMNPVLAIGRGGFFAGLIRPHSQLQSDPPTSPVVGGIKTPSEGASDEEEEEREDEGGEEEEEEEGEDEDGEDKDKVPVFSLKLPMRWRGFLRVRRESSPTRLTR